ncbi:C48 family peptidase [Endozoicomonas sp. Mp262]
MNDQILNACFTMAQKSHKQLRASQSTPITAAILHSQFFIKIQTIGTSDRCYYDRWLATQGFHIKDLEYLIIPANARKHWFIAVIDIPEDRIEIYNSLPGHSVEKEVDQITNWWLWYSSELYDTDTDVASCPVIYHHKIRQAEGSNDCGVVASLVATCIPHGLPPTKTIQEKGLNQEGLGKVRAVIKRAIQENNIDPLLSILRTAN